MPLQISGVARQLLPSIVCELNYLSRSFYLTTIADTYSPYVISDATANCHDCILSPFSGWVTNVC
jgi:hypothetical protein